MTTKKWHGVEPEDIESLAYDRASEQAAIDREENEDVLVTIVVWHGGYPDETGWSIECPVCGTLYGGRLFHDLHDATIVSDEHDGQHERYEVCAAPDGREVIPFDPGDPENGPKVHYAPAHEVMLAMTGECPWCGLTMAEADS